MSSYADGGGGKRQITVRLPSGGTGVVNRRLAFAGRPLPYHDQPANQYWLKHYQAILELDTQLSEARSASMRASLRRELAIAERKAEHWTKHINFDARQMEQDAAAAKRSRRR